MLARKKTYMSCALSRSLSVGGKIVSLEDPKATLRTFTPILPYVNDGYTCIWGLHNLEKTSKMHSCFTSLLGHLWTAHAHLLIRSTPKSLEDDIIMNLCFHLIDF